MPNVYGRRPRTPDGRDYLAHAPRGAYTGAYVNLESGFPAPWDQGQLGSCVSHGTCAAAMFALRKVGAATEYDDPSRLFHYYAARLRAGYDVTQDTGMQVRDGFASLAKDGIAPATDWPYDVTKFAERPNVAAWADASEEEATVYGAVPPAYVDNMIASGYPVVIGFDVYESFESATTARNGVMPVPNPGREQQIAGHCVVLVSTPKDGADIPGGTPGVAYRRGRNSWGTNWGDGGWFWYPDKAMVYASDFWQVTTVHSNTPTPPPAPTPPPDTDDMVLAKAFRADGWVTARHVGENAHVARAAKLWLVSKGL